MPALTQSPVRRRFNQKALEIAGVFHYLARSRKRSAPINWPRLTSNVGFLRAADELLADGMTDAASRTLSQIDWPMGSFPTGDHDGL